MASNVEMHDKRCGRCGYVWTSPTQKPLRCPHCGTYYWCGESVSYACAACGHTWFTRTSNLPARCPSCRTRSWKDGSQRRTRKAGMDDDTVGRIIGAYSLGKGCVEISISTGLSLSAVMAVLKAESREGGRLRM